MRPQTLSATCYDKRSAEEPSTSGEVQQHILLKQSFGQQEDGVLNTAGVSSCLCNLGRAATGLRHVYQFLNVAGQGLSEVSVLCNYVHLQKLELAHNKIKDLSFVSHMPYLIILDASHNELCDYFGFHPPKNLKEVNLSYNNMREMKDLSAFKSISKLKLDHNSFIEIRGLEPCSCLTHLSLAHNKISRISGLDSLPLKYLYLMGNQLKKIEGLDTLGSLQVLDLSVNRIRSLSGLQNLHLLYSINLESNLICEIKEVTHIHDLFLLSNLNLEKNPVQEEEDYRLVIIFLLQHLMRLDKEKVTAEEKVSTLNKYDPPLEVVAARNHMTQLVYQLMQPQVLYDSTLPSMDSAYPMLVLTGPQGCGKRELAHKLCHEFSEYIAYGACHTTRGPYLGEEDGVDYHFVSEEEFQNMVYMGSFVQTMEYEGQRYGLSREAIENVAREGLICCVHMELEGVFSLQNCYFELRYILLIPTHVERYVSRLRGCGLYTQAQIDAVVWRIDHYAVANREQPGFFNYVVPCDDQAEAYNTLRQLLKDYVGLVEQMEGDRSDGALPDHASTATAPLAEEKQTFAKSDRSASASCSALEPPDLSCRNMNQVHIYRRSQNTSTELASIGRSEQLVREALAGKSRGNYSQIFKMSAQTPLSFLPSQSEYPGVISIIDEQHISKHIENSSDESCTYLPLSVPTSTRVLSEARVPDTAFEVVSGPDTEHPVISALGHTLVMPQGQGSLYTPNTPHQDTEKPSPGDTLYSARPGSDAKPILPPIPLAHKTPALPPAPQTRCSAREQQIREMEGFWGRRKR